MIQQSTSTIARLTSERDAYQSGCDSAKRGANEWYGKWQLNETEKINLRGQNKSLTAELAGLKWPAQLLVNKLSVVHADAKYLAVWTCWQLHFGRYTGPTYEAELNDLTAALQPKGEHDEK